MTGPQNVNQNLVRNAQGTEPQEKEQAETLTQQEQNIATPLFTVAPVTSDTKLFKISLGKDDSAGYIYADAPQLLDLVGGTQLPQVLPDIAKKAVADMLLNINTDQE